MRKFTLILSILVLLMGIVTSVDAHRSGCHRWHSCPSDTGSYICGDAGYPCQYPTYPESGGVVYPPATDSEIPTEDYQAPKVKTIPEVETALEVEIAPEVETIPVVNSKNLAAQAVQDDESGFLWWFLTGAGVVGAYVFYRKRRKK